VTAVEELARKAFERAISDFVESAPYRDFIEGRLDERQIRGLVHDLFLPHYQSAHIIAFAYSLLANESSDLLKENLLEEMGEEEGEEAHPDLLIRLARGAGYDDAGIAGLIAESRELARHFCAQPLPFSTLRDIGLAIMLESASFETFLSRHAEDMGRALRDRYGLSEDSLTWFMLHGELDIRHAEEALTVLRAYVDFHQIEDAHAERIMRAVMARNPFGKRYFPSHSWEAAKPRAASPSADERLRSLTVYRMHIPFREAFRHAQFERSASDSIVVRVEDAAGNVGYGESLARDYVTGETVDSVIAYIRDHLAGWAFSRTFGRAYDTWDQLAAYGREHIYGTEATSGPMNNAAYCAVELAILDLVHRREGLSVAAHLQPSRPDVVYSGVVSAEAPEAAVALARRFVDGGLDNLKLKVGVGDDLARIGAVRKTVGDRVRLRVDANGAWQVAEAIDRIRELAPLGIDWVEQPVSHATTDHVAHLREVQAAGGIPVMADESLVTVGDARALVETGACGLFNVRVAKNGGLTGASAIAEIGHRAGLRVQVGAQVGETAILTAAGRHLAGHVPELAAAEGSFGTLLLEEDLAEQQVRFGIGGAAPLLAGPGLGVDVRPEVLGRLAVETIELKP